MALFIISCQQLKKVDYDSGAIPKWGMGPFVRDTLAPLFGTSSNTFLCPITKSMNAWEEKSVFNSANVVKDDKVIMIYRAEDKSRYPSWGTSRLGIAISHDGRTFEREASPVLFPEDDFMLKYEWPGGCQDPRLAESEDGTYILTYTAYDGDIARLAIASSKDLYTWDKHGLAFKSQDNGKYNDLWSKAGAIVCRQEGEKLIATKINGKYWMYFGDSGFMLAYSEDLIDWHIVEDQTGDPLIVLPLRPNMWDDLVVEPGAIALITDEGLHMIYNGGARNGMKEFGLEGAVWAMGQVMFSNEDPSKVIARTSEDFFRPKKDYEIEYKGAGGSGGGASNVTFAEGLVWFNNQWRLYYGCADSYIASAVYKK